MNYIIGPADLAIFADINEAKAQAMIDDAMADASRVAPCINDAELTATQIAQFRSVLRAAILRWNDSGTGAVQSENVGPFGRTLDTRVQRRGMYWPSEIESLQDICRGDDEQAGAFSIDTVPVGRGAHAEICSLNFGALYCSCGAVLTNNLYPLYEV